jgi:hypothetical protein
LSKRCSAVSISDCRSQGVFIWLSGRDLGPARQRRIRLLTKLEITPPSFSNHSRYGTDAGLRPESGQSVFIRSLTSEIHPEKIAKDLDGMMKVVAKHGAPIQFPTAWSQFPGGLFYGDPLWVDEVAMRYPSVPIILTKMGRSIGRYFDSAMTVAMRNVNIYFDVVGTNPQHLRFAIDKIGAHRILFGTDWSATWRWISV